MSGCYPQKLILDKSWICCADSTLISHKENRRKDCFTCSLPAKNGQKHSHCCSSGFLIGAQGCWPPAAVSHYGPRLFVTNAICPLLPYLNSLYFLMGGLRSSTWVGWAAEAETELCMSDCPVFLLWPTWHAQFRLPHWRHPWSCVRKDTAPSVFNGASCLHAPATHITALMLLSIICSMGAVLRLAGKLGLIFLV